MKWFLEACKPFVMRLILKFTIFIFLPGTAVLISCRKDNVYRTSRAVTKPPVADAGNDTIIVMPADSAILDASGSSDPDDGIAGYQWKKIAGQDPITISNSSAVKTGVNRLAGTTYLFELTVTDKGGLKATDTVAVTVYKAGTYRPPMANAGNDENITLPQRVIILDGSKSPDPDHNIKSFRHSKDENRFINVYGYAWEMISGPGDADIEYVNEEHSVAWAGFPVPGVYLFVLTIADKVGKFQKDTVSITVIQRGSTHWAMAGSDGSWTDGSDHAILGIDPGHIYTVGSNHEVSKYINQSNNWNQVADYPGPASEQRVSFGVNGQGYVGMGTGDNFNSHIEMYQYDPEIDKWTQKNNSPLYGRATSMVINNLVYLFQGVAVWMYDPARDTYTQKNDIQGNINLEDAAFVIHGEGYSLIGTKCWKYNAAADSWEQKAGLPVDYVRVQAGFSLSDYGYVLGDSSYASLNYHFPLNLWRYDPARDQWQRVYDDYPGNSDHSIKSVSVDGVAYLGFGTVQGIVADYFWSGYRRTIPEMMKFQ